jgi:hypothetical protein
MSGPPQSPSGQWPLPEVIAWRQSIEERLKSLRELIDARIGAMDKATELLADDLHRVPTILDREIATLERLFDEKTKSLQIKLKERDDQAQQDKATAAAAVKIALDNLRELIALQNSSNAAAIAKSELSTASDLIALDKIINATKDGLSAEINNVKQRLDRGEGAVHGQKELRQEDHLATGSIVGITGAVVALLALVIAAISYVAPHDNGMTNRLDALSARLNSLQAPAAPNK